MEVVLFGILTALCWISSMTFLLPLLVCLKFNEPLRNRWFSWMFENYAGPLLKTTVPSLRKRVFEIYNESIASEPIGAAPLEILEIGIGSGLNLQFLPENSNLTAVDMNKTFEPYFLENLKDYPLVKHKRTVISMAENMPEVEDCSMDIVLCTFVLCSVKSIASVLAEVKRVLKPGGKFLFIEHVAFPKGHWGLTVQKFASPLWRIYFDGCVPDQDIAGEIRKGGYSDVLCENSLADCLLYHIRPRIVGMATK